MPMNSGLIWMLEIRGAWSASCSRGCDEHARPLRLFERVAHDLLGDAGDLDVHLQGSDARRRPRDLEVHVAEMVLRTLDVGEDDVVVPFLDEAHRDARNGRRDRYAGVHQGQRRATHRSHRRGAVRLERLGDETDRVGELLGAGDNGLQSPLCQSTVPDVAALGAAHEAGLADREGREVVVVDVVPVLLQREIVDALAFLRGAERAERHDLRLATREERRAVGTGRDGHLAVDRADLFRAATVRPSLLDRDLLTNEILVDSLGSLLHVLLGHRVLLRCFPVGSGSTDRERQLDVLENALEEDGALP
jgi:hypothetical protein